MGRLGKAATMASRNSNNRSRYVYRPTQHEVDSGSESDEASFTAVSALSAQELYDRRHPVAGMEQLEKSVSESGSCSDCDWEPEHINESSAESGSGDELEDENAIIWTPATWVCVSRIILFMLTIMTLQTDKTNTTTQPSFLRAMLINDRIIEASRSSSSSYLAVFKP